MSTLANLAWPIQIAGFLFLFVFLPHGPFRFLTITAYILISVLAVGYIRRRYR